MEGGKDEKLKVIKAGGLQKKPFEWFHVQIWEKGICADFTDRYFK